MTQEEALHKTKDLLHDVVRPQSTEWDMAIINALYEKDCDWFKKQLDQVIEMCNKLKEAL